MMERQWLKPLICAVLFGITVALYLPVRHFEFLNYDDDDYVTDNPHVLGGFTRQNIKYSIAHFHSSNWHPVTWFSHMADAQIWGKDPGGHHLTSVIIHAANAILLFLVFSSMTGGPSRTGSIWRSAFIAAVFAWHPLHVESVAWVSERKDVLSAFFWILTMAAYVSYVRRLGAIRYLTMTAFFALALMSKPMAVTLPAVLLLLDYWPLQRARLIRADLRKWMGLLLEKTPLLIFGFLVARLTISTQIRGGALKSMLEIPWPLRALNTPVSYAAYLGKAFWPVKLAVFYPMPASIPIWEAAGALVLILVITLAALAWRERVPFVLIGWLWFVGTLIPVIGLIQVGSQAMADRYTYIPLIGLTIAVAWGVWEWIRRMNRPHLVAAIVLVVSSLLMIQATARQLPYWKNSVTLFQRAISVTSNNAIAYGNLSAALLGQNRADEAAEAARQAIRIYPNHPVGYHSLGMAMMMKRRPNDALANLEKTAQLQPDWPDAHQNLGGVLVLLGRPADALSHFYKVLQLDPNNIPALKAIAWIRSASSVDQLRDSREALQLANRAVEITNGKDPQALDVLASAMVENGQFDEAIKMVERAKTEATSEGKTDLANEIAQRIDLYRLKLPYRTRW